MEAKVTEYKGNLYRSRTEAKWAVVFDDLKIQFEYESKMFNLSSGNYWPDFWLPVQQVWIEIKGDTPTAFERQKAIELGLETKTTVYIIAGSPITETFPDNFSSSLINEICGFSVFRVNMSIPECERFSLGTCNNALINILRLLDKDASLDVYRETTARITLAANRANQIFTSGSSMREIVAKLKQEMFGWRQINK
jgi:hypothetical protein